MLRTAKNLAIVAVILAGEVLLAHSCHAGQFTRDSEAFAVAGNDRVSIALFTDEVVTPKGTHCTIALAIPKDSGKHPEVGCWGMSQTGEVEVVWLLGKDAEAFPVTYPRSVFTPIGEALRELPVSR